MHYIILFSLAAAVAAAAAFLPHKPPTRQVRAVSASDRGSLFFLRPSPGGPAASIATFRPCFLSNNNSTNSPNNNNNNSSSPGNHSKESEGAIKELIRGLNGDIWEWRFEVLRSDLKRDIWNWRNELKKDIESLKVELKGDNKELKKDIESLKEDNKELKGKFEKVTSRNTVILVGVIFIANPDTRGFISNLWGIVSGLFH